NLFTVDSTCSNVLTAPSTLFSTKDDTDCTVSFIWSITSDGFAIQSVTLSFNCTRPSFAYARVSLLNKLTTPPIAAPAIIPVNSFLFPIFLSPNHLDRKSTRLNLQSRFDLVCRLLLEKKK